jgi:GNAT superfamily N-acetyltransferase
MRFLASVGPSADAELYLRLFRARGPERFATIVVEADAIAEAADSVAVDLRFLQTLELTPVVVLGFDARSAGEAAAQHDALCELLDDLEVAIERFGPDADHAAVARATAARRIPILLASHGDEGARVEELAKLLSGLRSHKLIVLGEQGGISAGGERLSVVNLSADYSALAGRADLSARDRSWLQRSRALVLDRGGEPLLVSLTSSLNLLRELFTVKGAGTLLRKGARIQRHTGLSGVDVARLRELLESSFGRPPNPDLFSRPLRHCYLEHEYRGAALIVDTALGSYLSKFAVTREAQGEGIGQDLMSQVIADHQALFWRARPENPVRPWYERTCQGRYASGPWIVYFRGLPPERVPEAIAFALAQPIDFS